MQTKSEKQLKKVSNVEKNFIYECEICYEDYDTIKHVPMIVCSNYHALCAHCVKSNLFKKEYNAQKNPTGRYLCSKCSEIIQKEDIREHSILKEVCSYIKNIRQKDEELRKEFYNHVGTMGMNLVAMREDYDVIEKNNLALKKENQFLVKENYRIRDEFLKIQRVKGSLEELEKVAIEVEEMKETLELQNAKLDSLKFEIQRKNDEIKKTNQQILVQKRQFFSLQREIAQLRQDIKTANKRNRDLLEQNQGAINLKEYIEQEINNLQNQKKKILKENDSKKRKVNESLKMMQKYWQDVLKSEKDLEEMPFCRIEDRKRNIVQKEEKLESRMKQESKEQKNHWPIEEKLEKKNEKKVQESIIDLFDHTERSIKNFEIDHTTVTLINDKLSSFVHISFQEGFNLFNDSTFTVKINKLQSQQIMIGLMTQQCKNKKNIYDRKGFYGVDGFAKAWSDGNCDKSSVYIRQGDRITVKYFKDTHSATFSKGGKKDPFVMKLPNNIKHNMLYPVVLLIIEGDSFEVVEIK